jgi:predicted DCC family thiol-disulfide oxidoreductase YuxK
VSDIPNAPILLYNDECAVCRPIAKWVQTSARNGGAENGILVRPIGDDPEALRRLNASLDIWDAYATIHLLMPDGSMKLGGEAVAEVLRRLPNTTWFAWTFTIGPGGFRPFQVILNIGYAALSDIRPLLGCASCGSSNAAIRTIARSAAFVRTLFQSGHGPRPKVRPVAATHRRLA